MNIVSFLPAATEMVYALGLGDDLKAISHECDYPEAARTKPVAVHPALDLTGLGPAEIDARVTRQLHEHGTIYEVDERILREARPDLLLTQNLCQVCAPSGNEASRAVAALDPPPTVLWMSPHSVEGVFENIRDLGRATHREPAAEELVAGLRARLERLHLPRTPPGPTPRVFCLEWVDPVFCSGHWVPEMVRIAGGIDLLGRPGEDSVRIPWDDVVRWAPEILVVAPCGGPLTAAREAADRLRALPGYRELPAVVSGRVFAVDSSAYLSRPGPRVVDGVELLAHLIDPARHAWNGPKDAFERCAAG
ncbi:MAG TPA: cobalamin-binding protein [Thermoplasmata archaeon]|nr:cobalamin-binding protein [Thermoplasmata archaeon]